MTQHDASLSRLDEKALRQEALKGHRKTAAGASRPYRIAKAADGTWTASLFNDSVMEDESGMFVSSGLDTTTPVLVLTGFKTAQLAALGAAARGGGYQIQ